jgi:hypothetical protein
LDWYSADSQTIFEPITLVCLSKMCPWNFFVAPFMEQGFKFDVVVDLNRGIGAQGWLMNCFAELTAFSLGGGKLER